MPAQPRGPYRKPDDAALLSVIRRIVDERPTYGYRRIPAPVNQGLRAEGEPVVYAMRVLRIRRANGLILAPHKALHRGRAHDGVVVALRSHVRGARTASNCIAGRAALCGSSSSSTPATAK